MLKTYYIEMSVLLACKPARLDLSSILIPLCTNRDNLVCKKLTKQTHKMSRREITFIYLFYQSKKGNCTWMIQTQVWTVTTLRWASLFLHKLTKIVLVCLSTVSSALVWNKSSIQLLMLHTFAILFHQTGISQSTRLCLVPVWCLAVPLRASWLSPLIDIG